MSIHKAKTNKCGNGKGRTHITELGNENMTNTWSNPVCNNGKGRQMPSSNGRKNH